MQNGEDSDNMKEKTFNKKYSKMNEQDRRHLIPAITYYEINEMLNELRQELADKDKHIRIIENRIFKTDIDFQSYKDDSIPREKVQKVDDLLEDGKWLSARRLLTELLSGKEIKK